MDTVFTLKEEQRIALKAFLGRKEVFTKLALSLAKLCDASQLVTQACASNVVPRTNRKPRAVAHLEVTKSDWSALNVIDRRFVQSLSAN